MEGCFVDEEATAASTGRYQISWGDWKGAKNIALLKTLQQAGKAPWQSQATGEKPRCRVWEDKPDGILYLLKMYPEFSDVVNFPTAYLTVYNHADKLLDKFSNLADARTNAAGPDADGNGEEYGEFEQLVVSVLSLRADVKEEEKAAKSQSKEKKRKSEGDKKAARDFRDEAVRGTYGKMDEETLKGSSTQRRRVRRATAAVKEGPLDWAEYVKREPTATELWKQGKVAAGWTFEKKPREDVLEGDEEEMDDDPRDGKDPLMYSFFFSAAVKMTAGNMRLDLKKNMEEALELNKRSINLQEAEIEERREERKLRETELELLRAKSKTSVRERLVELNALERDGVLNAADAAATRAKLLQEL